MATPTYTPSQIQSYLTHIAFPTSKLQPPTHENAKTKAGLTYLSTLQRYHLATVPFENISLHYSQNKTLSFDCEDLFDKIVNRKRGGYCMELNQFFGTVLRSLGYDVVSVGGRVCRPDGRFGGWDHQVSLVVLEGIIYLVDVGFGSRCPTRPLPLISEHIEPWGSTLASNRLIFKSPSNPIIQGQWILQHRIPAQEDWKSLYSFTLTEFHRADFEVMNLATSTSQESIFTKKILVVRMLLDDEKGEVGGVVTLEGARLKRRMGDIDGIGEANSKVKVCRDEGERVEELKEWFGICLGEEEVQAIKGSDAELCGS